MRGASSGALNATSDEHNDSVPYFKLVVHPPFSMSQFFDWAENGVHVESAGFAATLVLMMKGSRQDVALDSHGGGQVIEASITMNRR